jgi:serine/threonine protein kinase
VIEKLGSGGMGVIYRAEDLTLGRQVALKFLPLPSSEAGPQMLSRFRREARAASALNHPNICTIHSVEDFAGQPVIVMELVEGETLAERLARGPLLLEKALPLAVQMAGAMAEAHGKGIVHRDLKPANIMLTKAGVKVLDFGLAKVEGAVPSGEDPPSQAGAILGSWHYMSPEQVQGKEADGRSDIFSFGCVLLEMLTGERAFPGDTAAGVMSAILTKGPDERFQSVRDLAFRSGRAFRRLRTSACAAVGWRAATTGLANGGGRDLRPDGGSRRPVGRPAVAIP